MKYVSLFAGVGGFDLALNRQGHECVYVNEWDKYSAITYEKNFCKGTERQIPIPQERQEEVGNSGHGRDEAIRNSRYGFSSSHGKSDRNGSVHPRVDTRDITTVPITDIPDHDLLVGGFPCQAFSIAGKRRGFDDTRGTLFFEIARILKDKKTKYFILENVKGLLSHDNGRTIKIIFSTLTELGYDIKWQVLNSKDFGVPQNRERIIIVGHLRGTTRPEVFPIFQTGGTVDVKLASTTIDANYWKGIDNHGARTAIVQLNQPKHSNDRVYGADGLSPTLNTMQGGRRQPKISIPVLTPNRMKKRQNGRRMKEDGDPSFTLTGQDIHGVSDGTSIRRLTPLECERLQGFPDNWTKFGADNELISDTQRYKMCGNAVTTNVVAAVVYKMLS